VPDDKADAVSCERLHQTENRDPNSPGFVRSSVRLEMNKSVFQVLNSGC
jgi:hypothetical protein